MGGQPQESGRPQPQVSGLLPQPQPSGLLQVSGLPQVSGQPQVGGLLPQPNGVSQVRNFFPGSASGRGWPSCGVRWLVCAVYAWTLRPPLFPGHDPRLLGRRTSVADFTASESAGGA